MDTHKCEKTARKNVNKEKIWFLLKIMKSRKKIKRQRRDFSQTKIFISKTISKRGKQKNDKSRYKTGFQKKKERKEKMSSRKVSSRRRS